MFRPEPVEKKRRVERPHVERPHVCPKHKRSWQDIPELDQILVCDFNPEKKLYLVEWSDRTRTWETKEKIQTLKIEALMPSYIS